MAPPDEPTNRLRPYIELVATYVEGGISAEEFDKRFSEQYLNDDTRWSEEEFDVLDRLFADTDSFDPDPAVRAELEYTIDETELHACASQALAKLRELTGGT